MDRKRNPEQGQRILLKSGNEYSVHYVRMLKKFSLIVDR